MIPGDQLPTRTEQKEACGAQAVLASILQTLGNWQAPRPKIDAAAACLGQQTVDLQLNTVAEQPYHRIRPLPHR